MTKKRAREPVLRAFGARLRELRGRRTREQISRQLDGLRVPLGQSTLAQYEKGTVKSPDPAVVWGLSQIYRVPAIELILMIAANRLQTGASDWRDLTWQGVEIQRSPHVVGGTVDTAAARRVTELERHEQEHEALIRALQGIASRLVQLVGLGPQGGAAGGGQSASGPGDRRAG